jgi:putative transposase
MDYQTKQHAKYLILYHLILVCKYRKSLLIELGEAVKASFATISASSHFGIETMEVDQGHIYWLVSSEPHLSPVSMVRKLKQESTYALWQHDETMLKPHFWKERTFWSDGYFCCSVGNASQEVIHRYSETQG